MLIYSRIYSNPGVSPMKRALKNLFIRWTTAMILPRTPVTKAKAILNGPTAPGLVRLQLRQSPFIRIFPRGSTIRSTALNYRGRSARARAFVILCKKQIVTTCYEEPATSPLHTMTITDDALVRCALIAPVPATMPVPIKTPPPRRRTKRRIKSARRSGSLRDGTSFCFNQQDIELAMQIIASIHHGHVD